MILIPGLDSTKEEFHEWEAVFLRPRDGQHSLEGAGRARPASPSTSRPDYEVAVATALNALAERPGVSTSTESARPG